MHVVYLYKGKVLVIITRGGAWATHRPVRGGGRMTRSGYFRPVSGGISGLCVEPDDNPLSKIRVPLWAEIQQALGSAMKKSLVTDSAEWCFSVYSASTRI